MGNIAYFDPVQMLTVKVNEAIAWGVPGVSPNPPPVMTGEKRNMVVACDFSKSIHGMIDGVHAWHQVFNDTPRGLAIHDGKLYVGVGSVVEVRNPLTGALISTITIPGGVPAPINSVRINVMNNQQGVSTVWMTLCFFGNGAGMVRTYTMASDVLTLFHSLTQSTQTPRDAYVDEMWLWTADTFGHKVFSVTLESHALGALRKTTDVYFPNSICPVPGAPQYVDILAEHENRAFRWNYNVTPNTRDMIMSAPVAPFNDILKTKAQIEAEQTGTFDPASTFTPKKSKCATECSGTHTLYSPNCIRAFNDRYLIADCDNGRVVTIHNGQVVGEVNGFNNPVTAVLISMDLIDEPPADDIPHLAVTLTIGDKTYTGEMDLEEV